jgi:hypothetical protein
VTDSNESIYSLFHDLLIADTEEEVVDRLRRAELWDNEECWRYYGDNENNFSTIGNQQSRPEAALVEKIVNSIDAKLVRSCIEKGIEPESKDAPQTIKQAVAWFFEDNPNTEIAGVVSEWTDTKRTDIAKTITITATGGKPDSDSDMSLTIADDGEGQAPDRLPETFLSLSKSNKLRTPFVQGKFNMGGTGALKFCGDNNLQLIVSRRCSSIVKKTDGIDAEKWSFTVVRRENPSERRRSSVYTYLAPLEATIKPRNGKVLRFAAENVPLFPEDNLNPYARMAKWGSLIKLYEYRIPGARSNILRKDGLLYRLELMLPRPALPIRLYECRTYRGHAGSFDTTLTGIRVRLEDNKSESQETGFGTGFQMVVSGERINGTIYAFKSGKANAYKKREGVIFAINGQTHAIISSDFFRRKTVGLSYLSDSLLVILDCSELSARSREDLFMNSRDRLSAGILRDSIEKQLQDELKGNQLLRELRERRRRELIEERLSDQKPMADVLQDLVKNNPTLASLFGIGQRITNPFKTSGAGNQKEFKCKKYPTYFKFKGKDVGYRLEKLCHMDQRFRITFETDACNDYFTREVEPGNSSLKYVDSDKQLVHVPDYALNLQNGIATLNAELPVKVKTEREIEYICDVVDRTQIKPIENRFIVKVLPPIKKHGGNGKRHLPPSPIDGDDREKPLQMALPNVTEVYQDRWTDMDPPFDDQTAVITRYSPQQTPEGKDTDSYDFFVNMDNKYLKYEMKNGKTDPTVIAARFKYGLVLYALAIIHEFNVSNGSVSNDTESSNIDLENIVEKLTRAVGRVIVPVLDSLGSIDIETVGSDYSADD